MPGKREDAVRARGGAGVGGGGTRDELWVVLVLLRDGMINI